MACKYNAPNGKKSELYDKLYQVHGHKTALKAWAESQTESFKNWYNGKIDKNGEPIIANNLYFLNNNSEKRNLEIFHENGNFSNKAAIEQIDSLTEIFTDLGLDIEVQFDTNIKDAGQVFTINGKTTVKFNTKKVRSDSFFHEFSHLFVDLLQNDRVFKRGIENLRGSELWNSVAKLYSDLNEEELGKEVLTTAIGIEAQKIYDTRVKIRNLKKGTILDKIKGWAAWFHNAIKMIGVRLGINRDITLQLAYALTGSKKRYILTGKLSEKIQKQKTLDDIIKDGKELEKTKNGSHYIIPKHLTKEKKRAVQVDRVTTAIDDIRGIFPKDAVIESLLKSNKDEWAHFTSKEELEMFWADKREEGTGIHNITEDYINARNKGKTREDSVNFALSNLYKPDPDKEFDEDNIRYYEGMDVDIVRDYIDNIADFIESLLEKDYTLFPEVKVFDEAMGVGGTIDLLVRRKDGKYMIYDWKTKEQGKFDDFYQYHFKKDGSKKMFNDLMDDVEYTTARSYALQLATYQLILERQGFEFVKDDKSKGEYALAIIPLVGVAQQDEKGETRYVDVDIAPDDLQGRNEEGVLPLESVTERLKYLYLQGEDLEKSLQQTNEYNEIQEDLKEKIDRDEAVIKWLQEAIINLQKSVTVATASGIGDSAAKYKKRVEQLIKEMSVADENLAIVAYNKFITAGIKQLFGKFGNRTEEYTNKDGVVEKRIVKGFANWTWKDIKNIEENNPEQFVEFLAFMLNTDMFMSQAIQIKKLPARYSNKVNPVFADLKSNLGAISDLQWKLKMLSQQLDLRYEEISSNPLSGGRGVLDANSHFFEAQRDLSTVQAKMDALADTHNRYLSNVMRAYDYKKRDMEDEKKKLLEDWMNKLKELEDSGSSLNRFIDKETGKTITKLDYDKFKKARAKAYAHAKHKYKPGTKAYYKIINDFFAENVELRSEEDIQKILALKKEELSSAFDKNDTRAYDKWFNDQVYYIKGGKGAKTYKYTSVMYTPKESKYGNKIYDTYNQKELEFHDYLTATLAYLVDHTKSSMVNKGYLPGVPKNMKKFLEQFAANMGWRKTGDYDQTKGVTTDVNDEIVYFIPFMFNNLLNQKKLHKIPDDMLPSDKQKLNEENELIRKENKEAHAAAIEMDLAKTMPIFIKTALTHKHKKAMEFELLRVKRSFIENHQILALKNNAPVVDKVKYLAGYEDHLVKKGTKGSKLLQRYDDWLRMIFYEEFENDEGLGQKLARVAQNYTSLKSMALNPYSAVNNQAYGTIMSKVEAFAGEWFSAKDWRKATLSYTTGLPSYFADDENTFKFSSKQSAFMHHLPIMMDFRELAINENQSDDLGNVFLNKIGFITNKAFMFEHLSEHNLQNRTLLAMANSYRIVDGKIIKFSEFTAGKIEKITSEDIKKDPTAVKEQIAKNKEKSKTLKEEFEKHNTLYESYEFVDGKLKLKKGVTLKKNEIAEFQRTVLGVNQYLHGIYNKEDAGAMQQYALGRLAIQFRKWMRPGWTKRFGSSFGKSEWNERRSHYDEGMYVSTWNFLTIPLRENIKLYKESKESEETGDESKMQITVLKALGNIVRDYTKFITTARLHWHTLNDTQKANILRTIAEYAAFCMAIGLYSALKEMKGDTDDPPLPLMLALYQLDRTATELTTYVPTSVAFKIDGSVYIGGGWLNETKKLLKSPTAVFNVMGNVIKLGQEIVFYPFASDEDVLYKGGVYHGENKLSITSQKMVPIWSQVVKTKFINKNYRYYKLF